MPQINIGTSNITTFGFSVTFDILNRLITFNTAPFTTGAGLANTKVAFSVTDSAGVILASIDFTNPQIPNPVATPTWVLDLSDSPYAFLFSSFSIVGAIQDQSGQVYSIQPLVKTVCMPNDFQEDGSVPGMFQITPDCSLNTITVKEITVQVYNSLAPINVTKSGTLYYPTGTISAVIFTNTPFSNNQVYTGQYRISNTTSATYALGNDFYVIVGYVTDSVFDITCVSKMSDLLCCLREVQQTAIKNCDNAVGSKAKQQIQDITIPFVAGMMAEIRGIDASTEYWIVKKTLSCSCGNSSIGQNEVDPVNPAVNTIVISGAGGTTVNPPTITGNTKTFVVTSSSYKVTKGVPSDPGLTIGLDNSIPNVTTYPITLNYLTLAQQIYTATANDPTTLAQFNALVEAFGFSLIGLNGKCIIGLTEVSYVITQAVTGSTGVAQVVINGNIYNAPGGLLATSTVAFANWLNSLSVGVWSVTLNSGIVTVRSDDNTNTVSTITFTNPNIVLQFQSTNATLVQILQAIINYLCGITALQIAVGNAFSICTLDYNGTVVTTPYAATSLQSDFNTAVSSALCNLAGRMATLTGITCAKLQGIFQDYPAAVFNNASDRYLSIVGGNCTTLNGKQQALAFISQVNSDPDVKNAFCAIDCTVPGSCPDISNTNLSALGSTSIGLFGLTYNSPTAATQTVTVKYRITGTSIFTTATSGLLVLPNGNLSGTSPYVIAGLAPNTSYDIFVQNNCGGTGFIKSVTTPASTVISANYLLDNATYTICGRSPVTLYSSVPFASGITMYSDVGLSMPVTGFSVISSVSTGQIFLINSLTGVVGANTGLTCSSGTAGTYILGNSSSTVCSGSPSTYYTNGPFAVGKILYNDPALSSPVTGSTFLVQVLTNNIFNLNTSTGQVGSATGLSCSMTTVRMTSSMAGCTLTAVAGIAGFTPSPAFPMGTGGVVTGTHGSFTGGISCTIGGSPIFNPSNITLTVNGVLNQCLNVTSAGTYSFSPLSYLSTDVIEIDLNTGGC